MLYFLQILSKIVNTCNVHSILKSILHTIIAVTLPQPWSLFCDVLPEFAWPAAGLSYQEWNYSLFVIP